MSLPIHFVPEARAEFDVAVDWYEAQRIGLGGEFITRVRTVLDRIADNPRLHEIAAGDVR